VSLGKALKGDCLCPRASAEKFPRGVNGKRLKNSKKRPKNSTIKPLPEGEGATEKRQKIALFVLSLYYICTMYENPEGARAPLSPLPTTMPLPMSG